MKYGILSSDGSVIAEPVYLHISPFKQNPHNNKMGNGYEVTQETSLGWLSVEGKEILLPVFTEFRHINNLIVTKSAESTYNSTFSDDGEKITDKQRILVDYIKGGYTEIKDKDTNEKTILDKNGNVYATSIDGDLFIYSLVEGKPIAAKKRGAKFWGFIDNTGKTKIDYQFDEVHFNPEIPFTKKYTRVEIGGKMGIIDENGEFIIPAEYYALSSPQDDFAIFMTNSSDGYIDYQNNRYSLQFDEAESKFVYKDKNGNKGHKTYIEEVMELIDDSVYISLNGKWGMMDGKHNIIVDIVYDDISPAFYGKLAFVKKGKKYAFIHRDKGLITDFIYDDAFLLMKDYGLGVMNGLYALINTNGQLTDARFSEIGTPVEDAFNIYNGNKIPACGGMWDYAVLPTKNRFTTKDYKHNITDDYNSYMQLNLPDEYSAQAYFKAYDAKDKKSVMILEDGTIKDMPISISNVDPVFNRNVPKPPLKEDNLPNLIVKQKITGVKSKINPKYKSVDDFYYITGYHSKTLRALEGYTNRFYHTLGVAVSYWIMARLHDGMDKYINLQYVYDKLQASYLVGIDPDIVRWEQFTDEWLLNDSKLIKAIIDEQALDEADQTRLDIINKICYTHSSFLRYGYVSSFSYYREITKLIVLARMVLPTAKKTAFDKWLDEKLKQGKKMYTSHVTYEDYPQGSYYLYADEFVPLEFFFDDNFDKEQYDTIGFMKNILEMADWEHNPYLNKTADVILP